MTMLGIKHTQETREKIRQALLGRKRSPETIEKLRQIALALGLRGEKARNYKGGRCKGTQGYIMILKPNHPYCNNDGYVMEHRLVMEQHLGRYLTKHEIIRHTNKINDDNRVENLQLVNTEPRSAARQREISVKSYLKNKDTPEYKANAMKSKIKRTAKLLQESLASKMIPCDCGCEIPIHSLGPTGKPRRFKKHHTPKGPKAHDWKGGRLKTKAGYIIIYKPHHHFARGVGYIPEHRYVWEQHNNACLLSFRLSHVHHINHDRSDNRIENLKAMTREDHEELTHKEQSENFKQVYIPRHIWTDLNLTPEKLMTLLQGVSK